jgi:hypothetical protein
VCWQRRNRLLSCLATPSVWDDDRNAYSCDLFVCHERTPPCTLDFEHPLCVSISGSGCTNCPDRSTEQICFSEIVPDVNEPDCYWDVVANGCVRACPVAAPYSLNRRCYPEVSPGSGALSLTDPTGSLNDALVCVCVCMCVCVVVVVVIVVVVCCCGYMYVFICLFSHYLEFGEVCTRTSDVCSDMRFI